MRPLGLLLAVMLVILPAAAGAAVIRFSYEYGSGDIFSGRLVGEFRSDGTTFDPTSLIDPRINGNPVPAEILQLGGSEGNAPVATLDGSLVNILFTDAARTEGFQLLSASIAFFLLPQGVASTTVFSERFAPSRWSAEAVGAIPLPATALLLLGGAGTLLLFRRRG